MVAARSGGSAPHTCVCALDMMAKVGRLRPWLSPLRPRLSPAGGPRQERVDACPQHIQMCNQVKLSTPSPSRLQLFCAGGARQERVEARPRHAQVQLQAEGGDPADRAGHVSAVHHAGGLGWGWGGGELGVSMPCSAQAAGEWGWGTAGFDALCCADWACYACLPCLGGDSESRPARRRMLSSSWPHMPWLDALVRMAQSSGGLPRRHAWRMKPTLCCCHPTF